MYSEEVKKQVMGFYNKESESYSKKRYEGKAVTYTQFFFRNRLSIVISLMSKVFGHYNSVKVLEMACADGVVMREVKRIFPNKISLLDGMDISPDMIAQAKKITGDKTLRYFIREDTPTEKYDVVLGIGYVSPDILEEEFQFALDHLSENGYYICSLPGKGSLHSAFKLKGKEYAKTYLRYSQYEDLILEKFNIISYNSCGLFIPKLWALPFVGRFFQPIFDSAFKYILPNAFHERVYLLQKKS